MRQTLLGRDATYNDPVIPLDFLAQLHPHVSDKKPRLRACSKVLELRWLTQIPRLDPSKTMTTEARTAPSTVSNYEIQAEWQWCLPQKRPDIFLEVLQIPAFAKFILLSLNVKKMSHLDKALSTQTQDIKPSTVLIPFWHLFVHLSSHMELFPFSCLPLKWTLEF